MEKSVSNLFTQEILHKFLSTYQLEDRVNKLGDFENYVFEVYRQNQPFILRVTHSSHRDEPNIVAELDWVQYLYNHKVNCPKIYPSSNQKLIEKIKADDGSSFFGCLFSKVKGAPVKTHSEGFVAELFYAWGKEIGKMHYITKNYQPAAGIKERPSWREEELLDVRTYFPNESLIIEITEELIQEIESLPKDKDNYGLIHSDIHSSNFFYEGNEIFVFDFDDCSYHWFASDIAIPLYYSIFFGLQSASEEKKAEFARTFLDNFMKGYEEMNPVSLANWKEQLPLFFKLRDITLYSVLQKKIAPEERDEELNQLLKTIYQRIINKKLIVSI